MRHAILVVLIYFLYGDFLFLRSTITTAVAYTPTPPPVSPATNLPNRLYQWRSQQIRYQMAGDPSSPHAAVLVHGLFVNSDHWRRTLKGLADAGYRAYAIDLLGYGYSSKPTPWDVEARRMICGELRRFDDDDVPSICRDGIADSTSRPLNNGVVVTVEEETTVAAITTVADKLPSILQSVQLGTRTGGKRMANIDLRHPTKSPYNFYTWAEQISDFTKDVVLVADTNRRQEQNDDDDDGKKKKEKVTLVANSIGTISALQSVMDCPELYDGVFVVSPNFRELHVAELPFPGLFLPLLRFLQKLLRTNGHELFKTLATPDTVKQILMKPYAIREAVDDDLVHALLSPLLTRGADDVVFDTLSYSAGPLPEQQLADASFPRSTVPVWVTYGSKDPWTPAARVEALKGIGSVERIVKLDGIGHCPHDEAPHLVNPLLVEFMKRVKRGKEEMANLPTVVDDMEGATMEKDEL